MKHKYLNYSKARKALRIEGATKVMAQFGNASYAVNFSTTQDNAVFHSTETDEYDAKFRTSYLDAIVGNDGYSRIRAAVSAVIKEQNYSYNTGFEILATNLIVNDIRNSIIAYSMLLTIWRAQTGYLNQNGDAIYTSPILLNHDWKGFSDADWNVSNNNSYLEYHNYNETFSTKEKIKSSGEVFGTWSISNEEWDNFIKSVLEKLRISRNAIEMCERLFTCVHVDVDASDNMRTATFFPCSYTLNLTSTSEIDTESNTPEVTGKQTVMTNYDAFDQANGFTDVNNTSSFADMYGWFQDFIEGRNKMAQLLPFLDDVYSKLGFKFYEGDDAFLMSYFWNFKRKLHHDQVICIKDNVSDLIQSTCAYYLAFQGANFDDTIYHANEEYSLPPIVKDKANDAYNKRFTITTEIEMNTYRSYELALRGKITPLRFAYIHFTDSATDGQVRYQPVFDAVPVSSYGTTDKQISFAYLMKDLHSFGALIPLMNVYFTSNTQQKGNYFEMVCSDKCFTIAQENAAIDMGAARDSFVLDIDISTDYSSR